MQNTQIGLDHLLLLQNRFQHYRIGLVTNNAAFTSASEPARAALLKNGFNIVKLFSPEHGLTAKGEDGALQSNIADTMTGLPVISLYGDHFKPTAADLADIDLMIFDIPDIGCRFYTYLWTMSFVMEACALHNKPLVIPDRPNPIGGDMKKSEGPLLDEENCSSFIGRWRIPIRHSCTLGELAKYFAATRNIDIDLEIIELTDWNRNQPVLTNQHSFVSTSPAITSIETALCYPGTGLLEGINVNEGRGTNSPFTQFGAPWIDTDLLLQSLNHLKLGGVQFSKVEYVPSSGMYAGESCKGLSILITDEDKFLPVHSGLSIIQQIVLAFPENCRQRLYKTAANPSGEKHLDKLSGIPNSFNGIKEGISIRTSPVHEWREKIDRFLLYT